VVEEIREHGVNGLFLPGITLSPNLRAEFSLTEAVSGAGLVLSVVPSHGVRAVFDGLRGAVPGGAVLVSASKGIEEESLLTPAAIIREVLGGEREAAVLSGPSFAAEVAKGLPTAVSVAAPRAETARRVQEVFSTPVFRVYTSTDVVGVELGGALKNVMAIAAGISDGLGLGYNARAALITRGLAEMSRLGVALGARERTFSGLSGLGDLVLTCTGPLSRNYTVGLELGRGRTIEDIVSSMKTVAEGVKTSRAVLALAGREDVEMPIAKAVSSVIEGRRSPMDAVSELMGRELKEE
jgi:glycerol-3-phosphate dehydrogenase (NAD(P)+)